MLTGFRGAIGLLPVRHIELPVIPGVPEDDLSLRAVDGRIRFYDYSGRLAMNRLHFMRFLQLCIGAAIPVSQVVLDGSRARIAAASLGALVFIIQGMESYLHDAEHYPAYRTVAEQMKRERMLFAVKAGPYASPTQGKPPLALLVENIENMAGQERQQWLTTQRTPSGPDFPQS